MIPSASISPPCRTLASPDPAPDDAGRSLDPAQEQDFGDLLDQHELGQSDPLPCDLSGLNSDPARQAAAGGWSWPMIRWNLAPPADTTAPELAQGEEDIIPLGPDTPKLALLLEGRPPCRPWIATDRTAPVPPNASGHAGFFTSPTLPLNVGRPSGPVAPGPAGQIEPPPNRASAAFPALPSPRTTGTGANQESAPASGLNSEKCGIEDVCPGGTGVPPVSAPVFDASPSLQTGGTPDTVRISGMGILPMRDFPNMGKMPMPRFSAKLPVMGETPVPPVLPLFGDTPPATSPRATGTVANQESAPASGLNSEKCGIEDVCPGGTGVPPVSAPVFDASPSLQTGGTPDTVRISGMGILPMRDFPNMGK
ncbi:MAG: hypothetical protein WCH98_17010, partial [Verrucomicrobiota bacterium]